MSQVPSAVAPRSGTLVNAPSWSRPLGVIGRGVVSAPIAALVATLLFNHFDFALSWFVPVLAFFAAGWALVVLLSTPSEPVLLVTPTAISVSRWGAQVFHSSSWQSYPMQPLAPELRRGGRGGSYVRMYMVDARGWRHRLAFTLVSLDDLRKQLMQAGCTVD